HFVSVPRRSPLRHEVQFEGMGDPHAREIRRGVDVHPHVDRPLFHRLPHLDLRCQLIASLRQTRALAEDHPASMWIGFMYAGQLLMPLSCTMPVIIRTFLTTSGAGHGVSPSVNRTRRSGLIFWLSAWRTHRS